MAKTATKSITITARVTPEVEKLLRNFSRAFRHTRSSAVQSILEQFLGCDNWVVKEIKECIASAKKGPMIPHEQAMRQLNEHKRSWRAKHQERKKS